MTESVCIIDFAGNNKQPGCWCDYYPEEKTTRFGGFWCDVPDLVTKKEPTEKQCESHARKYEEQCLRGYLNFIEADNVEESIQRAKISKRFYPGT